MSLIDNFSEVSSKIYINGSFSESKSTNSIDVIDPATEDRLGQIPETTQVEMEDVIASANKAQKIWNAKSALDRSHVLHEVANKISEMGPLFAEALTREMGKPYKESMDEVHWSVHNIRFYAEMGRGETGKVIGSAVEGQFHYTLKQPLGTCVLILPFNYPMVLLAWEASAALAAGNSVIIKPSQYTSLTTLLFAKAFSALPEGLFQVVTGEAPAGKFLVEHPDTHMIAFTGSVPVGVGIASKCGELMKRSLIENSGNDPFIVMPSAPMDITARAAAFSAYMNCGQICVSAERFFVHEKIHDEFVEKLVEETKKIRVGNGLDKVDMGPIVSEKERDRYEKVLNKALSEGAEAVTGGERLSEFNKGWFVAPTVLTNCSDEMSIFNNESFGPVAPICKVSSFDEAMQKSNNSKYGLGANIYTSDLSEGIRAAEQFEAGMVWVNAPLLDNDAGTFGGTKLSGMGRQLGAEGLETFRDTKTVMIDPDCQPQDFWWFPYPDEEMYKK